MFAELLDKSEKKDFAYLAKKIILADGKIDAEEKKYLDKLVLEVGEIDDTSNYDDVTDKISKFENIKKRAIISELIIIAKCDDNYDDSDVKLLKEITMKIGVPEAVYNDLNSWTDKYLSIMKEGNSLIEG